MKLAQSPVVFDAEKHTYMDGNRQLSGITSLIKSVLHLGIYPNADAQAQQISIPRAGYYGNCVHKAIYDYDRIGIKFTEFPEKVHVTQDFGVQLFPAINVADELDAYIAKRGDREVVESEYTVSYGDYASKIDSIWKDGDKIILVDFKTNNVSSYPGGKAALIEYLSWQLSCYAFMFWKQTGIKADIKGMHIRGTEAMLWDVPMQPMEKVEQLLNTPWEIIDGAFVYTNPAMQVVEADPSSLVVPSEVTSAIANLIKAEKLAKEMKERLRELMTEHGIVKWECDYFTASLSRDTTSDKFDQVSFKSDHPEMYDKYIKTTPVKGSLRIKAK